MDNITVEGANGGLHTNYGGKAEAAVKALTEDGYDFVYVHIEAPTAIPFNRSTAEIIAPFTLFFSSNEVSAGRVPAPQNHAELAGFFPSSLRFILIG